MADTDTLGSMLQGISQQPPHLRQDGQVTEQVNFLSHVTRGITSRPGTVLEGINISVPLGHSFTEVDISGDTYQVGTNSKANPNLFEDKIIILDTFGTQQTVTITPSAEDYIGDDMDVYVYDNKEEKTVFLFNRDFPTAMITDVTAQQAEVLKDVALITSLGGQFSHTYKIFIEDLTGNVVVGTYTTPDGTNSGDAAKVTSDFIAVQLRTSLEAQPNKPAGMVTAVQNSVVQVRGIPGVRAATEDGSGGDTLVYQTNTAKSTTDLADLAPHGTLVRVVGLDGTEDDFWMRFEVAEETVVGNGFGTEGLWREWYNVDEPASFDPATMPHQIKLVSPGVFSVEEVEWAPRARGDADTNPVPGFIGKSIRDINGFQSRLVVVAGALTNMAVTNEPNNFFKQSAVAEIATDPIEMLSTAPGEFSLQYIVPFDRDLIICGDQNQFIIEGGQGLTAANASMTQTTKFEMSSGVRPSPTGKTFLFPFTQGEYSGIKEFFSSNTVDANQATTITELVPKLLRGQVIEMKVSTNFDTALIQTDLTKRSIYVYKYLWSGDTKVQSAWSRWDFQDDIENFYFDASRVYILLYSATEGFYQVSMDLDIPDNTQLGYNLALDANTSYTTDALTTEPSGETYSRVTLPFPNMTIMQGDGCTQVGQTVTSLPEEPFGDSYRYYLNTDSVPQGATVWAGLDYTSTLKPTMPFIRDGSNKVMRFVRLVLTRFIIHFEKSGPMTVTRSSRFRSTDVSVSNASVILDLDPNDPDTDGVESGSFDVPFREQSDISELTITASGGLPVTINEIEWVGQARGGKRRR